MTDLEQVAKRLFWWKSPTEALADPHRFVAQVMVYGTPEDSGGGAPPFPRERFPAGPGGPSGRAVRSTFLGLLASRLRARGSS